MPAWLEQFLAWLDRIYERRLRHASGLPLVAPAPDVVADTPDDDDVEIVNVPR